MNSSHAEQDITALPYLLGLATIIALLGLSVYLSYRLAIEETQSRGAAIASEVLDRAHAISRQIEGAFKDLQTQPADQACSEANIRQMRNLAMAAGYLRAIGYVKNDRLLCSSYGHHGDGIELGPPDYTSRIGYGVRSSVQIPLAAGARFLVTTNLESGYCAFALPSMALEVMREQTDIGVGLFGVQSGKIILHRGPIEAAWMSRLNEASALSHRVSLGYLVTSLQSSTYDYAVYVAQPQAVIWQEWLRFSAILIPLGALAGFALAGLIVLQAKRHQSMPQQLLRALDNEELSVAYQPIVNLQTGQWVGAEALLRWRQANGSWMNPAIFIPVAERNGLIRKVTNRVIEIVTRDFPHINQHGPFRISVNFSATDLADPTTLTKLNHALLHAGMKSSDITVEVTESVLVDVPAVQNNVSTLRNAGTKIAIDDFGTGYCGLSYLSALELDYLKVDKCFVDTIGTDAATSHVVAHIIEIAKSLGLGMVAEGVETETQAQYLREHGVEYAQGWLYSKALPLEELCLALTQQESTKTAAPPA